MRASGVDVDSSGAFVRADVTRPARSPSSRQLDLRPRRRLRPPQSHRRQRSPARVWSTWSTPPAARAGRASVSAGRATAAAAPPSPRPPVARLRRPRRCAFWTLTGDRPSVAHGRARAGGRRASRRCGPRATSVSSTGTGCATSCPLADRGAWSAALDRSGRPRVPRACRVHAAAGCSSPLSPPVERLLLQGRRRPAAPTERAPIVRGDDRGSEQAGEVLGHGPAEGDEGVAAVRVEPARRRRATSGAIASGLRLSWSRPGRTVAVARER